MWSLDERFVAISIFAIEMDGLVIDLCFTSFVRGLPAIWTMRRALETRQGHVRCQSVAEGILR